MPRIPQKDRQRSTGLPSPPSNPRVSSRWEPPPHEYFPRFTEKEQENCFPEPVVSLKIARAKSFGNKGYM
jgi:hypothetical protein